MVVAAQRILEHKGNMQESTPNVKQDKASLAVGHLDETVAQTADALHEYMRTQEDASPDLREHTLAMAKIVGTLSAKINAVDESGGKDFVIPETKNPLLSPAFLVPAFLLTASITVGVWLFSLAGVLKADVLYITTAVVAFLLVFQVLLTNVRNLQLHRRIAKQSHLAIDEELKLEKARAELFSSATEELQGHLFAITAEIPPGTNKSIDDAAGRLMSLLDRMSLISNLTSRGADYVLNTEEIDVAAQLAHIIAGGKADAGDAKVSIDLHAPKQMEFDLDPLLLEQAIKPVLDNAVKFSKDASGGGQVHVALKPHKEGFELRIADNGPGIAPERRAQLFKPFSRGEDALRFNYEGAGLGLYLASLATGLLGGSLEIADSKQGAEFVWKFSGLKPATDTQKPGIAKPNNSLAKHAA